MMLKIFKGDDTGGRFGRSVLVEIEAAEGISLDGCRAEFELCGIVKGIAAPLVKGEVREVQFSAEETSAMCIGITNAAFRVFDPDGKVRTFSNTIPVRITDAVSEVYSENEAVTIMVGGGINWANITGKPNIVLTVNNLPPDANGNVNVQGGGGITGTFDMECSDWDFRRVVAEVWKAMGGTVVNEE